MVKGTDLGRPPNPKFPSAGKRPTQAITPSAEFVLNARIRGAHAASAQAHAQRLAKTNSASISLTGNADQYPPMNPYSRVYEAEQFAAWQEGYEAEWAAILPQGDRA